MIENKPVPTVSEEEAKIIARIKNLKEEERIPFIKKIFAKEWEDCLDPKREFIEKSLKDVEIKHLLNIFFDSDDKNRTSMQKRFALDLYYGRFGISKDATNYLSYKTGNKRIAEEMVQDAFLKFTKGYVYDQDQIPLKDYTKNNYTNTFVVKYLQPFDLSDEEKTRWSKFYLFFWVTKLKFLSKDYFPKIKPKIDMEISLDSSNSEDGKTIGESLPQKNSNQYEELERKELENLIKKCWNEMPETQQKKDFYMSYYEKMTDEEIAQKTNRNNNTVRQSLLNARAAIVKCVQKK